MGADGAGGDPRRHRDEELPAVGDRGDLAQHRGQDLRLHREHDHVGLAHQLGIAGHAADAVLPRDVGQALRLRVRGENVLLRHQPGLEHAADHGLAHVPCAEESHPLALDAHARFSRGPKIEVPTRTMVAPSSMATA